MRSDQLQRFVYCGKRGCVESVISGRALQIYYNKISGKKLKFEEIYTNRDNDILILVGRKTCMFN